MIPAWKRFVFILVRKTERLKRLSLIQQIFIDAPIMCRMPLGSGDTSMTVTECLLSRSLHSTGERQITENKWIIYYVYIIMLVGINNRYCGGGYKTEKKEYRAGGNKENVSVIWNKVVREGPSEKVPFKSKHEGKSSSLMVLGRKGFLSRENSKCKAL